MSAQVVGGMVKIPKLLWTTFINSFLQKEKDFHKIRDNGRLKFSHKSKILL